MRLLNRIKVGFKRFLSSEVLQFLKYTNPIGFRILNIPCEISGY
jgi:hypothetical protein